MAGLPQPSRQDALRSNPHANNNRRQKGVARLNYHTEQLSLSWQAQLSNRGAVRPDRDYITCFNPGNVKRQTRFLNAIAVPISPAQCNQHAHSGIPRARKKGEISGETQFALANS